MPRVFVGTMHCAEGDYLSSCEAIQRQQDVIVESVVIRDLPEKEAHNALWAAWREARPHCDMFVKVDADTVLAHPRVLVEFWNTMQSNARITGIQAPLLDYFTDGFINGLNCFSPKVTFLDTTDPLYCDRVDVDHDIIVRSTDVVEALRPAGYHCFEATELQAFHFGVHRCLKRQTGVLDLVKQAWRRHHDRRRGLALLGATEAHRFDNGGFNYSDALLNETFESVKNNYDRLIGGL